MLKLKLRLLKDNTTLYVIMIFMSLLLAGVLGNAFGGDYKGTILVEDLTGSVEHADLIHALEEEGSFKVKLVGHEEGLEKIIAREALLMIVMDDDLKILELKPTVERFQVKRLLENEIDSRLALNQYSEAVFQIISENSALQIDHDLLIQTINQTVKAQEKNKKVFTIDHQLFNADPLSQYNPKIHYTVGMTLFFVTYSLLFTVGDYLEDRRLHTLDRMRVSPVSRFQILLSNIIPAFLIGSLQVAIMILTGKFLFGISWGQEVGMVILVAIVYIFTMTALSFFIVSLVKNMSQLGAISPVILTGMGMLGGCMWPLEIIQSKFLLFLSVLTPHSWAINGIESLLITGQMSRTTSNSILVLFLMGAFYMILAERILALKKAY